MNRRGLLLTAGAVFLCTSCDLPGLGSSASTSTGTLVISTIAGTGAAAFGGDGGPAGSAQLQYLRGMAVDREDNLYVADAYNHRVRVVSSKGIISTLAGNGVAGFTGDGDPARTGSLNLPRSVAVDSAGNVYIADLGNNRVRKVDRSGILSTVAGSGSADFGGDGGPATSARLNGPAGVAVDGAGNLFIADTANHRIRKVGADGTISTVAGTGFFGSQGDGGPALQAAFDRPSGIAIDRTGALYVADTGNSKIRKISPAAIMSTVAGSGTLGFAGDGGPATAARLSSPKAVAVDESGRLLIADTGNNRIRQVMPSGTITTIAGTGRSSFSGDGGRADAAPLIRPYGVAVSRTGAVYVADTGNNRIRKISMTSKPAIASSKPTLSPTGSAVPPVGATNVYAATTSGQISPSLAGVPERVYVPNEGSGTLVVIDPQTLKVVERFKVGKTPHHVTPSWDLTRLLVNNMDSNSLTAIDPRTGKAVGSIPVTAPYNLYFTVDGSKAIVVAEPLDRLDFYDPGSWKLLRSLPIPWEGANHLDMSADGHFLLVSSEYDGFVMKVDLDALAIAGQLDVGGLPTDVRLSADGTVFYVANQGRDGVSIVDPVSMTETGFLPTGRGAHGLGVSRDARSLFVTNRLEGTISVIDFATRLVRVKWTVGGSPDMVQVSPDGRQLWTTSRFDKTIYVVDTATGSVLTTISTDFGPHGLSYFPQPGRFSLGHNGVYR